jgi:hypothetical protein
MSHKQDPVGVDRAVGAHRASLEADGERYRKLMALALCGNLEEFVACNQLDHYHDADRLLLGVAELLAKLPALQA